MNVPAAHDLLDLHRKIFGQNVRRSPDQTPAEAELGQCPGEKSTVKYKQTSKHDRVFVVKVNWSCLNTFPSWICFYLQDLFVRYHHTIKPSCPPSTAADLQCLVLTTGWQAAPPQSEHQPAVISESEGSVYRSEEAWQLRRGLVRPPRRVAG